MVVGLGTLNSLVDRLYCCANGCDKKECRCQPCPICLERVPDWILECKSRRMGGIWNRINHLALRRRARRDRVASSYRNNLISQSIGRESYNDEAEVRRRFLRYFRLAKASLTFSPSYRRSETPSFFWY